MKIIIEGCDGVGKTTLVNLLANKYGLDVCHCTQHDPADFDFYKQTARKENIIWDRHTIGELIYPKVFNRKQQISPEDARIVLSYAKENGGKIFVLTAPNLTIRKRLLERNIPEDSKIMENIEMINDAFLFYAKAFNLPVIDTSCMNINEIFNMVEN